MSEWKAIDTAPRDKTEILAIWVRSVKHLNSYGVVWYEEGQWREFDYEFIVKEPTHWMPLPDAPKDTE